MKRCIKKSSWKMLVPMLLLPAFAPGQQAQWEKANEKVLEIYLNQGPKAAIPEAKELLQRTEKDFGSAHLYYAYALHNLACIYGDWGNFKAARPLEDQAITILKAQPDHEAELAIALSNMGRVSDGPLAENYYEQAHQIFEKLLPDHYLDYAASLYGLAWHFLNSNKLIPSEQQFQKAEQLFATHRKADNAYYATCIESRGFLYYTYLGRYKKAGELYQLSYNLRKKYLAKSHPDYQASIQNLTGFYNLTDPEKAEDLKSEEDEEVLYLYYPKYTPSAVNSKLLLGGIVPKHFLMRSEGSYREEMFDETDYTRSEEFKNLSETFSDTFLQAFEENGVGAIKSDSMSDFSAAIFNKIMDLAMKEMEEKVVEEYGQESQDHAQVLAMKAMLGRQVGDHDEALKIQEQTLQSQRKSYGDTHSLYQYTLFDIASYTYSLGRYEETEKYFGELLNSYLKGYEAFDYMSENERKEYWERIKMAIETFYFFALERVVKKPQIAQKVYNLRLATKSQLMNKSAKIKKAVMNSADEVLISKFEQWIEIRNTIAKASQLDTAEQRKKGWDFHQLIEEANLLEKGISANSEIFSKLSADEKVTWQDVQGQLGSKDVAVEILRFPKWNMETFETEDSIRYAAAIITPHAAMPEIIPLATGRYLERMYFRLYREYSGIHYQDKEKTKYKPLYDHYWKPVMDALPAGVEKVYLSGSGVYNQINLNTLYNFKSGKYILDEINLHYLSSTDELVGKTEHQRTNRPQSITMIGNPSFAMRDEDYQEYLDKAAAGDGSRAISMSEWLKKKPIPPLPGTLHEVYNLYKLFNNHKWKIIRYVGKGATEERVKQLDNPNVLHIATHGYFHGQSGLKDRADDIGALIKMSASAQEAMLNSGLLLAGVSNYYRSGHSSSIDDGILTAYEATTLNLDDTDLVVLSACETGLGRIEAGEGVYGLQRAFKIAGANTILMSLWKVSDEVTQLLMTTFYKNWLASGDKRKAFVKAQKKIKSLHPAPYYWGAFIMVE